jgi:hypothetical protein
MNQYTKHVWKRNITAIGIAALMVMAAIGVILVVLTIGVLLGDYLPHVVATILLIGMVFTISLPIRDYLKDKENAREYQRLKDAERKRNGWLPN